VKIEGPTPGQRYGHSINYIKPYIVVFGGFNTTELLNDVWILNIQIMPFEWKRVAFTCEIPSPRVYHTATLCSTEQKARTVIVFGGRGKVQEPLNDLWELTKGTEWKWTKLHYNEKIEPTARFQVNNNNSVIACCSFCRELSLYYRRKRKEIRGFTTSQVLQYRHRRVERNSEVREIQTCSMDS